MIGKLKLTDRPMTDKLKIIDRPMTGKLKIVDRPMTDQWNLRGKLKIYNCNPVFSHNSVQNTI